MNETMHDPGRSCPDCAERGALRFTEIPASRRSFTNETGDEFVDHFGPTRDYECANCDCEFTLTAWEPL